MGGGIHFLFIAFGLLMGGGSGGTTPTYGGTNDIIAVGPVPGNNVAGGGVIIV